MFKKIFPIILIASFLLNISTDVFSTDIAQYKLRSRAVSGTTVQQQIGYSIKASSSGLASRHTTEAMAKQIKDFLGDVIPAIRSAEQGSDKDEDANIQGYINERNAKKSYDIIENSPNGIQAAPMHFVEDLQDDEAAIEALKKGKLCLQMPFAGAGSRMSNSLKKFGIEIGNQSGQIPEKDLKLANINIWQIAVAMGKKRYNEYIKSGKTDDEAKKLIDEEGLILEKPLYAQDIGFAERHMLALEQGILNLDISSDEKELISRNLKLIVSVSDDIRGTIMSLFKTNSRLTGKPFFGLEPSNVVFVEGGYGATYKIGSDNSIVPTSSKTSWNHGFAFEELAWLTSSNDPTDYRVYTLEDGKQKPIDDRLSVFEYVTKKGADYSVIHRINDLILMHPDMALDIQMFGAFLKFKDSPKGRDANVFLEMMANPTKQKGGMALTTDNKHLVLFEGLNTKDRLVEKELDRIANAKLNETDEKMGVPYNRLYGFYEIDSIIMALVLNDGMPLSITYKDGEISPEIPTGDITLLKKQGIYAYAAQRHNDRFIDEGLATDQLLDQNNRSIEGKKSYTRDNKGIGSGAVIHDCKEAKYIPDGKQLLEALDAPDFLLPNGKERPFFAQRYYKLHELILQLSDIPVNVTIHTYVKEEFDPMTTLDFQLVTGTDSSDLDIERHYKHAKDCKYITDAITRELADKLIDTDITTSPDFISISLSFVEDIEVKKTVTVYSRENTLTSVVYTSDKDVDQIFSDVQQNAQTSSIVTNVSRTSSSGTTLAAKDLEAVKLAVEIANLSDATGTIVYNDTMLSSKQQQILQGLIGIGTQGLTELEAKLGCKVKLLSQGGIVDNARTIIISSEKLSGFNNAKYFITEQTQIDTSYVAVVPFIAIAKGLLCFENKAAQPKLYTALVASIRSLSKGLLSERDIEEAITAYINGNPMFIKLPPAVSYDYDQLEQLQRQALMILISA
jgi:hypothetical protein